MDSSRVFLAGRRCFFADGVPFLKLFGMSPHAGQNFDVRESVLVQCGVNLGDFLKANLTMKNELKDFEKIVYPLHVKVDKNFAIMRFASAEVTRDSTGVLVFKTKDFGPVKSMNQNLPLGSYEIVIKAIDSTTHYNITLCAEAISTASSPVMPKTVTFQNDYEMARNKTGKNPINHVVLSIPNRSTPHATSSAYEYIQSGSDRISDASQMYINTSSSRSFPVLFSFSLFLIPVLFSVPFFFHSWEVKSKAESETEDNQWQGMDSVDTTSMDKLLDNAYKNLAHEIAEALMEWKRAQKKRIREKREKVKKNIREQKKRFAKQQEYAESKRRKDRENMKKWRKEQRKKVKKVKRYSWVKFHIFAKLVCALIAEPIHLEVNPTGNTHTVSLLGSIKTLHNSNNRKRKKVKCNSHATD